MKNKRIEKIKTTAAGLKESSPLPGTVAAKLPERYLNDVPVLLGEIERLTGHVKHLEQYNRELNEQIAELNKRNRRLLKRLQHMSTNYRRFSDVFSAPQVVAERPIHPRVTDNRPPAVND